MNNNNINDSKLDVISKSEKVSNFLGCSGLKQSISYQSVGIDAISQQLVDHLIYKPSSQKTIEDQKSWKFFPKSENIAKQVDMCGPPLQSNLI